MKRGSFLSSTLCWALVGAIVIALAPLCIINGPRLLAHQPQVAVLTSNNYLLHVLSLVAIYTILAVGLNLLMGYAGQVSLGHAAFYGIGAYTSGLLTVKLGWSPWLALPAGIVLTSLVALMVGVPCLRLRGNYLAMATLGFGWIVFIVMKNWSELTDGISGLTNIPKLAIGGFVFDSDAKCFLLTWAAALLAMVLCANVVNSRVGRALRALHTSEHAAATLGVNVATFKVQVFVLAAALAALAGSLYAHKVNFISPNTFGFIISVELVVMVVVGGMASVWGAVVGATTMTFLFEWLTGIGKQYQAFQDLNSIAYGLIMVLMMIFMPAGLTVGARELLVKLLRRRPKTTVLPEQKATVVE